jgi:hypothetical protein
MQIPCTLCDFIADSYKNMKAEGVYKTHLMLDHSVCTMSFSPDLEKHILGLHFEKVGINKKRLKTWISDHANEAKI